MRPPPGASDALRRNLQRAAGHLERFRDAFPAWRAMPGDTRRRLLHRIADLIEAHGEEIALVESLDTGQPVRFMRQAAVRGAENFRFFADRAPAVRDRRALPAEHHLKYTVRQPIGPVGVIAPWNTPFLLSTWKIAPALAAGCTVVHKPAEWSPLSAMLLAEIMVEAGLPPGVSNLANGIGEAAGKALTEHPDITAVACVGEAITGSRIMAQGAPTLKRVHFELGGNARNDMRIAREEIFGPVLTAIPFDTEAEALANANDTPYGLAAYIWTSDLGRAHRLAREIDAGMVWVNSENVRHLPGPFGGVNASGIGRDGGDYSVDFYMETKNVCVALGDHRIPTLGAQGEQGRRLASGPGPTPDTARKE